MTLTTPVYCDTHQFLTGGGMMGALIAGYDWNSTALGPIETWSAALKTTIGMILRSTVPIVTLWHDDGVMIYNDAYSGFAGGRHPQLLGSRVREGWPEVADFNDHVMRVCLHGGGTLAYQDQQLTLHRHGVPEAVWMNLDYSPVPGSDGRPEGVIAFVVETTAKVRAEQRVLASEARFRTWAQAMPNQVWSATADGALDWFNQRLYDYTGMADGALDGDGWLATVLADDAAGAMAAWSAAVAGGSVFEREFRIRRSDGAYRWHLARAVPIHDADGNILSWIGSNTDIDQHKDSERALAYLNATLEQQVAQRTAERDRVWRLSNDVIAVSDLESRLVAVNPALQRLLGWDQAELLGQPLLALVHPDDQAATRDELAALAREGAVMRLENRLRHKDGGYRVLAWTGTPEQGHVHAIGRDVTAEREAAQAMARTEQALRQAQKMETIGKLTGGVAHDFNNLLQVISGNLQLLAPDVAGNARAERRLGNALAGVGRGAKLASHLLAFGRRQALAPKAIKLSRLVQGMEDMLRRSLGEEIEIETVISGGLWATFADAAQVENAVLNLAINGRDAMAGAGRLTIELGNAYLDDAYATGHAEVVAGQYVVLAVSDTGSGMAPEVLAQAFEPFFSTKPEGQGTGLGLSMVYGFAKQSGGHVKIYSEVGHGTTVKLYLPRSLEAEDLAAPVEVAAAVGGAETILVAEDDEQVRSTVVELLGTLGYRVLKAHDATAALTIIDSGIPIDLLFTDVVMPGPLRSPDLARKARERLPQLAVLFTSGYTENAIVHGGRLDAGVELLGKPYTKEALALKVRKVLAARPGADAARGGAAHAPVTPAPASASPGPEVAVAVAPLAAVAAAAAAVAPESASVSATVLLVEDDAMIRTNTAELLEYLGHVVLQAGDAATALALLGQAAPAADVLITDIGLPGMPGDVLAEHARQLRPGLGVIFATGSDDVAKPPGTLLLRKPYDTAALNAAVIAVRRAHKGG